MTRPVRKEFAIIAILILLMLQFRSTGQEYRFRHLTAEDGLPTNFCLQVIKDRLGFTWIATSSGLCRYDGYNIKVYQHDQVDSTSLSCNDLCWMGTLVIDLNGDLWIASQNGLNKYDPINDSFKRYLHDPEDPGSLSCNFIYCLYKDRSGTLWIGTGMQGGLNKYIPERDQFVSYKYYADSASQSVPSIFAIFEDHEGILWVGTADGLYQFDRENELFARVEYIPFSPDPANPVLFKYINEDVHNTLFLGTQFGYLTFNRLTRELEPFKALYDESLFITSLDILPEPYDESGKLWLIADKIYVYDNATATIELFADQPGITGNINGMIIQSFYMDKSGMLWLPSEQGINILTSNHTQIQTHPEFSKLNIEANVFLKDRNGQLWVGGSSLQRLDQENNVLKKYVFPENKMGEQAEIWVIQIIEDIEGNIWIGTNLNGLYVIEKEKDELVRCKISELDPYIISALFQDSKGVLWIGTENGLYQHRKDTILTSFIQDSSWGKPVSAFIICIYEDTKGNLWVGTQFSGLFFLPFGSRSKSTFINYANNNSDSCSLSDDYVYSVCEDVEANVWIATKNGLNKFIPHENRFKRYYNKNDLATNIIYSLIGDSKGYLWMSTESGIIRFNTMNDPDKVYSGLRYRKVLSFKDIVPNWLSSNDNGEIYIGASRSSGNGYYTFYPDSIEENTHIPSLAITDFKINNVPYALDSSIFLKKNITLSYKQNFFSFEFAALDFTQPEENQYAYYLEGLQDEWIYSGTDRTANYTGVPPGDYIFHAKGSNNDGYWNEEGVSLAITILPPPWKTWWAYMGYALVLSGIIVLWRMYDLRRIRLQQQLELEKVEANKLKEMDSMKSRFFANISHEFRTPLTLILGPLEKIKDSVSAEVQRDIKIMQRNAQRLLRLIDQLLTLSKIESGQMKLQAREENIVTLVNGYVQSFESLAKQKEIELVFDSSDDKILVYVDQDKMEKILYNLLSNAFKFTPAGGRVAVSVGQLDSWQLDKRKYTDQKKLSNRPTVQLPNLFENSTFISITDTGSGIAADDIDRIFDRFYQADRADSGFQEGSGIGLALTKELVELHHGAIEVESEVGAGSTFWIFLPVGKEHLKPEELDTSQQSSRLRFAPDGQAVVSLQSNEEPETWTPQPPEGGEKNKSPLGDLGVEKPLLLIVEDNPDLCSYMRGYLDELFNVLEAANGQEGLKQSIDHVPDLVVSDVMMPVMDGIEFCGRLKRDERTSHIPVILLTARAGSESRIEGLETGADDFITKPFDAKELIVRVNNLIRQRKELMAMFKRELEIEKSLAAPEVLTMDQGFLRKAKMVVEENMSSTDFSSEAFAKKMALSRVQLHRKLTALVGQSASSFIRTIRLNKAAELLANNAGSVKEIAFDVGFNTLPYFTKCFREHFGVNPSDYRSIQKR